jgi:hypothetical protein
MKWSPLRAPSSHVIAADAIRCVLEPAGGQEAYGTPATAILLFCVASGTEWAQAGITGATVTMMLAASSSATGFGSAAIPDAPPGPRPNFAPRRPRERETREGPGPSATSAGGLGISQGLDFLGHHSRDLGVTLGSLSCDRDETQGDDALDFETKFHRVDPWLASNEPRYPALL